MDAPARAPKKPYTPEEVALIDEALTRTKGHRAFAAKVLGIEPDRVYGAMDYCPDLRAKWGKPDVPGESLAEEVHRPKSLKVAVPPGDEAVMEAVTAQDEALAKGWKKMGMAADDRRFLSNLQSAYGGNLKGLADLTAGGLAHAAARLLLLLEKTYEKIVDVVENPDAYRRTYMTEHGTRESKGPDEYYLEFTDRAIKLSDQLRKVSDTAESAQKIRLQVEKLTRDRQEKVVKKVPGWSAPSEKVSE